MAKRSISIAGHRTSISLEAPFWEVLQAAAVERGISLPALVVEVDKGRKGLNLSAALRVHALEWSRKREA